MYKFHGIWHSRQIPINPIRLLMKNPNIKQLPKCGKNAKTLKLEIGTQFLQPCTTNTKSRFTTIIRVYQNITFQYSPWYYRYTTYNHPSFLEPDIFDKYLLLTNNIHMIIWFTLKTVVTNLIKFLSSKGAETISHRKILFLEVRFKIISKDNHDSTVFCMHVQFNILVEW